MTITLRPHQQNALEAMMKHDKGQVIIPTGGGKTICMIQDAKRQIDAAGSISGVKIVDGGSAFGIGNTLAVTGIGTTTGHVQGYVTVEQIHNSLDDVFRIDGIRDDRFKDYNNLYRITGVTDGDDVNVNVALDNEKSVVDC